MLVPQLSTRRLPRHLPRSGFTLMEMMVVVAIIVALAGIGIFYFAGQADEGNKTKVRADITNITQAAITYKTQHAGMWPDSLERLLEKDAEGYGPYLKSREAIFDPWERPYNYDPSGARNSSTQPDIWCVMPNNLGTIGNWSRKILPPGTN